MCADRALPGFVSNLVYILHVLQWCLNRKDELYNDLVNEFESKNLQFDKTTAVDEGSYILQVCATCII